MEIFHAIILGLVQGITEFLPISSSGHLVAIPWLFGWKAHPLIFDIALHLATFCAIVIYFRREWLGILRGGFLSIKQRDLEGSIQKKLFWYIIIASIPGIIAGSIIGKKIECYLREPMLVALMLGIFGLLLFIAELSGKKNKSLKEMTWRLSLLIGITQILALIPGVSRSGITISIAMLLGMNRESSVRFSFLLGAPIIFAAACYSMAGLTKMGNTLSYTALFAGFFIAFLSSLAAIRFLLEYIKRQPFSVFAVYRIALSVFILLVLLGRG